LNFPTIEINSAQAGRDAAAAIGCHQHRQGHERHGRGEDGVDDGMVARTDGGGRLCIRTGDLLIKLDLPD